MANQEVYRQLPAYSNAPKRLRALPRLTLGALFLQLTLASASWALGQDGGNPEAKKKIHTAVSTDVSLASKYVWRGQRLTDDWSLQPSGILEIGKFSVNVWGTMDLTAVNEGDSLYLSENPAAPPGSHSGMQGRFSEVDYTFSFAHQVAGTLVEGGSIVYTFPHRFDSLPSTVELFGGIIFETAPLSPAVRVFFDIDETRRAGDPGVYVQALAGHSFQLPGRIFRAIDISGSVAFVNSGFGNFYYGEPESGLHDVNVTFSLPFWGTDKLSASGFLSFSALTGEFRNFQVRNPRDIYLGTAGSPAGYADTLWGGISLSILF